MVQIYRYNVFTIGAYRLKKTIGMELNTIVLIVMFRVITPYSLASEDNCFGEIYYLHLHGTSTSILKFGSERVIY